MQTFFHPDQLLHRPLTYLSRGRLRTPQEVPDRATILRDAVQALGFPVAQPVDHGVDPIAAVHARAYIDFLNDGPREWREHADWGPEILSNIFVRTPNPRGILARAAYHLADGSCPVGADTYRAAYWSAQSALAAAEAVNGGAGEAYALCRPPGHHARPDAAGGFCYLNNAAIAAEALRRRHGRVAILDTDMHHGQGTQEIFYARSDVLVVSIHGDPTNFYPVVAGFEDERGEGGGLGFNLNLPMPHGSPEAVFFDRLAEGIDAVRRFAPDALVLSLGFDIYERDPQAVVSVTEEGFRRLGAATGDLRLPTVTVQEGGYHLESLADNAAAFFGGFRSGRTGGKG